MTSAQVVLRWHVQTGVIALPKSSPKDRMGENLESADVELTADEMASIDALGRDVRLAADPDDIDVDRALLAIPEVLPRPRGSSTEGHCARFRPRAGCSPCGIALLRLRLRTSG